MPQSNTQDLTWASAQPSEWVVSSDGRVATTAGVQSDWQHIAGFPVLNVGANTDTFYFEIKCVDIAAGSATHLGIRLGTNSGTAGAGGDNNAGDGGRLSYVADGRKRQNGTFATFGATYASGDVIGFSVNCSTGVCRAYKNGVDQGTWYTISSSASAVVPIYSSYGTSIRSVEFQESLEYLPSGMRSWKELPVPPEFEETGEGDLDVLAQKVGIIASGDLDALEQAVDLRIVASGNLDTIAQTVNATASGDLDRLAQTVRDATVAAPPFDLELIIGSVTIPANQIHGLINITRSESSAALMDVTLIPPKGMQNITAYQGKNIILNYIEGNQSTRIYTGKVDIPEIDILGQTITLRCTDNRTEQNNALPRAFVQGIGCYSEAVLGEAKDQNDEIEKRLRTVEASLDYDANGLVTYTSWTPKAVADFVFDDCSIYRRTPQVEVLSRGRVINKVNLDLTYRWTRLRHRERSWLWTYPFNANSWCGYLADNIGLCPVDAPRRAAEGAGWAIKPDTYQTEPLPESRWYRCGTQSVGWQTSSRVCESRNKTDDDGNLVTDSEGNQVVEQVNCRVTDSRLAFTIRAEWSAARRWAQTVEQKTTYTITAPQSIDQYGIVERDERLGTESEFNAETWERMDNYQSPPSNAVLSPNGDRVIDQRNTGLSEFNAAVNCATAKAVADIRGSHRQNYVTLQLPMQPNIDLRHTVETTAGKIKCKGKVYTVRYTIDVGDKFAETSLQIALSRAEGNAANNLPSVALAAPVDAPNTPRRIDMGTWVGGRGGIQLAGYESTMQSGVNTSDRTPAGLPKGAQGFITNYRRNRPQPLFTESFIVDTPAIEDAVRDTFKTQAAQTATVAIRNDLLEVVFDD